MIAKIGRALPSLLALGGLWAVPAAALAQGNTFNPFGNSGYADYREFGTPMYSNNPALPGQARLNSESIGSRPRANSFQQFSNELDGIDPDRGPGRRSASGNLPYYQAYQRLNSQYNRVYQPNNTDADRSFYEKQKQRDEAYAKALREPDPAKRAKMLRQVEQDSLTTARPATKPGTGAPKPPGSAASASAPTRTPATGGRAPAPPPTSGGTADRKPAATRAPIPGRTGSTPAPSTRPGSTGRIAIPDPSTIAVPPPR